MLRSRLAVEVSTKPLRTRQSYEVCLSKFTQLAKVEHLGDVTRATLEDFRNARLQEVVKRRKRKGQSLSPATVNRDLVISARH